EPILIDIDKAIRPGDESATLAKVVALIKRHAPQDFIITHRGVLDEHASAILYDDELETVIKDYQRRTGNKPDGIIGKMTIAALQAEQKSIKRDRILYSMERLRWLPHDFGSRYVIVNQ